MTGLVVVILSAVILCVLPGSIVENEMDDMDVIKSPLFWLFTSTAFLWKIGLASKIVLKDTICISLLGKIILIDKVKNKNKNIFYI